MRLITHNMLMCNKKGVVNGYPLKIKAEEVEVVETEFSKEFVEKMLPKLNWSAFVAAAEELQVRNDLPDTYDATNLEDQVFLKAVHHALVEVHVKKGELICPESGRAFKINNGIPNMLLREDEV